MQSFKASFIARHCGDSRRARPCIPSSRAKYFVFVPRVLAIALMPYTGMAIRLRSSAFCSSVQDSAPYVVASTRSPSRKAVSSYVPRSRGPSPCPKGAWISASGLVSMESLPTAPRWFPRAISLMICHKLCKLL